VITSRNPLVETLGFGQSIWYDNIRRSLITSGELERMVGEDALRGVTSNPAIFEKAIAASNDYADDIARLRAAGVTDAKEIYERLAVKDVQDAADILRRVYDESDGRDGYVSLEVAPTLASDTEGTVAEAFRLWRAVDRENLMIKVPATPAGIPAIRTLIGAGVNVNVTLLFSQNAYEQVADAFISGLEDFLADGGDVSRVASVASFFISRIDSSVDALLKEIAGPLARHLAGKTAIANAKLTYQRAGELYASQRWAALAARGAQTQRLLWASTGTKNPAYRDVLYVEELIGPGTVDTVPPATFDAFRDHGRVRPSLEDGLEEAHDVLTTLGELGIDFDAVTAALLEDGVRLFERAFADLLAAVASTEQGPAAQLVSVPEAIAAQLAATLADWGENEKVRRLWSRDATLWTGESEASWLGWLGIAENQLGHGGELSSLAEDVRSAGFDDILLLGMGGSSLFPELLARTFGRQEGFPELHVLDSTDPAQLAAAVAKVDLARTLFIVSSKSGSTLEPNIFKQYFFEQVAEAVGRDEAGTCFVAVTDPGSKIEAIAAMDGFRHVAHGVPSIGGRYSALSNFGMVPAAAMGVDAHELLDRADRMAHACASSVAPSANPGLVLGATIGVCANVGRDKLTLVTSPRIAALGAWLEQLVAESTGKQGVGVIPVDREPLASPSIYGDDRLFVYVRLSADPDVEQDAAVDELERAGHPVVRIEIADLYDIGGEVFRWEFATAVAGAVIGINPFDQPDVEASKLATRALTSAYERDGALPEETPIFRRGPVALFTDERNAADLGEHDSLADYLRAHLDRVEEGDYVALLAYVEMTQAHEQLLTHMRAAVRAKTTAATCVGFGPRFLHSTGQAYKGGPNSGVVLQITCDDAADVAVPGQSYTFGVVKAAQARGDFEVLAERGRRALRVHLGSDVSAGLAALAAAIDLALFGKEQ
jgi:transaldolase / glucose-6-phosphate isomerase